MVFGCLVFCDELKCQVKFVQYFFESGRVSSEGWMVNNKPDLEWKSYYESGNIKSIGKRKNGELDSIWEFYSETGLREKATTYKNGLRNGKETIFDTKG